MPLSRRTFLAGAGSSAAVAGLGASIADRSALAQRGAAPPPAEAGAPDAARPSQLPDLFPTQAPELVREMVTVAHFNAARVKELVTRQPSLARAAWDWGFGDWESALGAASHMGNVQIAEILLANGARPDLFSAGMLGQVEVVRALVTASPGVQRTRGPHGITLLAHARAGGERALPVLRFLESLGDADPALPLQPLAPEDLSALPGPYHFGSQPRDVMIVEPYQGGLLVRRADAMGRPLSHLGGRVFSPAGAEAVRLRFSGENPAATLTIFDPDPVLTARRS